MRFKIPAIVICFFCFFLTISPAYTADYKDWIGLLPDTLGGLAKAGDVDGTNIESSGVLWSTLNQKYSDNSGNQTRLSIVTGNNAPQVQQFQALQKFNLETEDKIAKPLDISGNEAFLELKRDSSKGTLLIAVDNNTIVAIETNTASNEKDLKDLAEEVPLSDIADQVK